jgi:hypothetical protein
LKFDFGNEMEEEKLEVRFYDNCPVLPDALSRFSTRWFSFGPVKARWSGSISVSY